MEHPHDPHWSAATPPPYPQVPPAARPVPVIPLGGYPGGYPGAERVSDPAARPAQRAATAERWRFGAVLAVAGAAALAFGTFLPWARADITSVGIVVGNGWRTTLGGTPWGPVILLLAFVVACTSSSPLAGVPAPSLARLGMGAAGAGVVGVALQFVELLQDRPGIELRLELGPFVMLSGALLAFVGAALTARSASPAIVAAPRAVGAVG